MPHRSSHKSGHKGNKRPASAAGTSATGTGSARAGSTDTRSRGPRPSGSKGYEVRGRLWIDGPCGTFLGHGRAVLIERIRDTGSITKAARSMGMSYRHAWELIESMNRQAPEAFVLTSTGGRGGGGTTVTAAGLRAMELYWKLEKEHRSYLKEKTRTLSFKMKVGRK